MHTTKLRVEPIHYAGASFLWQPVEFPGDQKTAGNMAKFSSEVPFSYPFDVRLTVNENGHPNIHFYLIGMFGCHPSSQTLDRSHRAVRGMAETYAHVYSVPEQGVIVWVLNTAHLLMHNHSFSHLANCPALWLWVYNLHNRCPGTEQCVHPPALAISHHSPNQGFA